MKHTKKKSSVVVLELCMLVSYTQILSSNTFTHCFSRFRYGTGFIRDYKNKGLP
jgi:hypothetical protein